MNSHYGGSLAGVFVPSEMYVVHKSSVNILVECRLLKIVLGICFEFLYSLSQFALFALLSYLSSIEHLRFLFKNNVCRCTLIKWVSQLIVEQ